MKLFTILIILLCFNANAKDWYFPVGKEGAQKGYSKKSKCKEKEGQKCFNIKGLVLADLVVADVEVPDESKPMIPTVTKEEPCADEAACILQQDPEDYCPVGENKYYGDRDEDSNLETWCIKYVHQMKLVKGVAVDESKKAAREAAEAAELLEKEAKRAKKQTRKDALVECAKTKIADFTASIQKNCIRALAREAMKDNLSSGDM